MKQKRMASGMIQASDLRNPLNRMHLGSGGKRELHGKIQKTNLLYDLTQNVLGYDGPLQYTMSRDNNPDQIISVLSSTDHLNGKQIE